LESRAPCFYELATSGPAPIANEALERIARLYAVESEIRGRGAGERRVVRQEKSRPNLNKLEPSLTAKLGLISQKTELAEAIRHALSRWQGLSLFLDDAVSRSTPTRWSGQSGRVPSTARTRSSQARTAAANAGRSLPR